MGKVIDLTGQFFGRLRAVSLIKVVPHKGALWLCSCRCGGTMEAFAAQLRDGRVRSCGCSRKIAALKRWGSI